ncbi:MAG: TetR-like C-terminal domain-containing protein [Suipraeoptans sp.]
MRRNGIPPGVHAVVLKWLDGDCKETPKEIAHFVEWKYKI